MSYPKTKLQKSAGKALSDPGKRPQFKWLPFDELFIEPQYQRSIQSTASRKNIGYMVAEFNWASCGALVVSYDAKRKKYAVIDGQHRMQAAKNRGDIKEMPCMIIEHPEMWAQAASFMEINKHRVNLTSLARFPAEVAAGNEMAIALKQILDEAKITVPLYPVSRGETAPRETCALGAMLRMLENCSKSQAVWVLTIIPEAYGEHTGQMRSALITTLAAAIKQEPKLDRAAMIEALRDSDPAEMQETARSIIKAQGGNVTKHMLDILMRSYRSKLRKAA